MLEEIKQLKERSRRQEKVIDELINNKMHHESEERTKIDHDKIQNHVVSSNRKRVQCAKPNNVDILCQQRDELLGSNRRKKIRKGSKHLQHQNQCVRVLYV